MKKLNSKFSNMITLYLNLIPIILFMMLPLVVIAIGFILIDDKNSIGFILSMVSLSMLQIISLDINIKIIVLKIKELKNKNPKDKIEQAKTEGNNE